MSVTLLGHLRAHAAIVRLAPQLFMAYRAWFWMEIFVQILALTILVFFWRAVYVGQSTLGGLSLRQTLDYIMLAQVMLPLIQTHLVFHVGQQLVAGQFAMELLRPLDLQARFYTEALAFSLLHLLQRVPLVLFAWLAFDLRLPSDPIVWGAFLLTLVVGHAVAFLFDWMFGCLAFYTTESWGLAMMQTGFSTFFSGALVPLSIMPLWLQQATLSMPFAQAIYVPISVLSQITPTHDLPRLLLHQLLWLCGLLIASRLVFRIAVRKVTVQGG